MRTNRIPFEVKESWINDRLSGMSCGKIASSCDYEVTESHISNYTKGKADYPENRRERIYTASGDVTARRVKVAELMDEGLTGKEIEKALDIPSNNVVYRDIRVIKEAREKEDALKGLHVFLFWGLPV